ncbi:MAG: hypothetical protein AABW65_00500 [Nanoarchaeota archaeon]
MGRGQFFLVAAIIIIGIAITIGTIYNSASSPNSDSKILYLTEEIKYEAVQLINSGTYNSLDPAKINENIVALTNIYSRSNPNVQILIIYGEQEILYKYLKNSIEDNTKATITMDGKKIIASINNGQIHEFSINKGYNFHVALKKETEGETYVASA